MLWYEYVLGAVLLITSILIIVFVLMQKSNDQGLSGAIVGGNSGDSFFGKNKGRTKEAQLKKITKILAVVFFVVAIGTTLILTYFRPEAATSVIS